MKMQEWILKKYTLSCKREMEYQRGKKTKYFVSKQQSENAMWNQKCMVEVKNGQWTWTQKIEIKIENSK